LLPEHDAAMIAIDNKRITFFIGIIFKQLKILKSGNFHMP